MLSGGLRHELVILGARLQQLSEGISKARNHHPQEHCHSQESRVAVERQTLESAFLQ